MAATQTLLNQTPGLSPLNPSVNEIRHIPIGKRTRVTRIPNVWIFSVFGLLMFTFLLYFHTVIVENQANRKQQEIIQLRQSNDALHAQLAELSSLPTVEQQAKAMGMQSTDSYRYINVSSKLVVSQTQHLDVSAPSYPIQPPLGF